MAYELIINTLENQETKHSYSAGNYSFSLDFLVYWGWESVPVENRLIVYLVPRVVSRVDSDLNCAPEQNSNEILGTIFLF